MSEDVRVGVYVCHCGRNIAGVVDVKRVVEMVKELPGVVVARDYLFMCSAPGQELIKEDIKDHQLNRVVVAACSPSMHEPTFRGAASDGGLNPYLLEMANIREHCSWVHPDQREAATQKAYELIRAAVAKARLLEPLEEVRAEVTPRALVLGGGVAGMRAALDLAERGFEVYLIEKKPTLGGMAARIGVLAHSQVKGIDVVKRLIEGLRNNPKVHIYTNSELISLDGAIGGFKATIRINPRYVDKRCNLCQECVKVCPEEVPNEYEFGVDTRKAIYLPYRDAYPACYVIDPSNCTLCGRCVSVCQPGAINLEAKPREETLEVGAVVTAIGYSPYEPAIGEFGYKTSPRVITLFQLHRLLASDGPTGGEFLVAGARPDSVAFIMCVGSMGTSPRAHTYCSRMCCSTALREALELKQRYPDIDIYFIYKDIRTYGRGDEDLYWQAIEELVRFVRFDEPPKVHATDSRVEVEVYDTIIQERLSIPVDTVVLATGMSPAEDTDEVRVLLKIGCGAEGFFKEAHLKLRPVEALTDGILLAGAATGPKNMVEAITSGSAAASKAASILSKDSIAVEPLVASVDEELCSGCGICVALCPFEAIDLQIEGEKRRAEVNATLCKACGTCAAACPSGAMQQAGFRDLQILAQVVALFQEV